MNREIKVYAVNDIAFSPTRQDLVATGGSDGVFTFWDIKKKSKTRTFPELGSPVTAITFNRAGNAFVYAVGYDWSKGYMENTSKHQTKLMLHTVPLSETVMN
jgi:mRNA export factor